MSDSDLQSVSEADKQQLLNKLKMQDYLIKPELELTEKYITELKSHFDKVNDTLRGQTYQDNTNKISTQLRDTYISMNLALGNHLVFLEN